MARTRSQVGAPAPAPAVVPSDSPSPSEPPPPAPQTAAPAAQLPVDASARSEGGDVNPPAQVVPDKVVGQTRSVGVVLRGDALVGDKVVAVFPEELYTPKSYNSYRVGPYTYETTVLPGETPAQAFARALAVVNEIGESERARKRASYLVELDKVTASARAH